MPYAPVNGIQLYYEVYGDNPQCVVFAHGAGGNHLTWWQQVPTISREFTCVTFDHRAFGASLDVPDSPGLLAYVEDLRGLLDHLGIQTVHLVAQSMGGFTCLGFAARYPHRTLSLVMADTHGGLNISVVRQHQLQVSANPPPPTVRAFAPDFPDRQPDMAFLYQLITGLNPLRPEGFIYPLLRGEGPTPREVIESGVPILFIVGSEDTIFPPSLIHQVSASLPGSHVVEVRTAGHPVYFEKPKAFNRSVLAFVHRHNKRASLVRQPI